MGNNEKKSLTSMDAIDKMCDDLRAIAQQVKFGQIFFPCRTKPSIVCEVHDGLIKQVEILYPERTVRYRSDKSQEPVKTV